MKIDQKKVEYFLNELKKRGKEVSGGNPNKLRPSYVLRDPEFYWNFGAFLVEQARSIDEDKRYTWIEKQTKNIEKAILGPTKDDWLIPKIYSWVDELQDKEHFMYVADLAGHKVGSFRIKVLEYIYEYFSKKNPPSFSKDKKKKLDELVEQLLGKKLTHLGEGGINDVIKKFNEESKTSLGYGLRSSFFRLHNQVLEAVENGSDTDRESLRNEIGKNMIDKLRTYLQILPLSDTVLFKEMVFQYKTSLNRRIPTKNEDAKKLDEAFGKCIKDQDLKREIMTKINAYEMGQTNNFLNAIESENEYEEWKRTKENFEQMTDD